MYSVPEGIIVVGAALVSIKSKVPSLQILRSWTGTTGFGLTIILYVDDPPGQAAGPLVDAVTVYTTVCAIFELLISVCAGIVPVIPLSLAPVTDAGELEDQSNETPLVVELKVTAVEDCPEHMVCGAGLNEALGAGFTVMVKGCVVPVQVTPALLYVGITFIVASTEALVELIPLNADISPVPLAASPIDVWLFVQGNVVPETKLLNSIKPLVWPLQITRFGGIITVDVGLTVIENVLGVPVQYVVPESKYFGVTLILATIGSLLVFIAVKELMSPLPDPANPIVLLSLVQE